MNPVVANSSGEALQRSWASTGVEYKNDTIKILPNATVSPSVIFKLGIKTFFIIFILGLSMVTIRLL